MYSIPHPSSSAWLGLFALLGVDLRCFLRAVSQPSSDRNYSAPVCLIDVQSESTAIETVVAALVSFPGPSRRPIAVLYSFPLCDRFISEPRFAEKSGYK